MKVLRGWIGEQKTKFSLWISLNANTYPRFHNMIFPSKSGTTQIDHILISPYALRSIHCRNKKQERLDFWIRNPIQMDSNAVQEEVLISKSSSTNF